jgi:hypothetical protein
MGVELKRIWKMSVAATTSVVGNRVQMLLRLRQIEQLNKIK